MSILPAAVEAEHAFSAASVLYSKIHSSLGDSTFDTMFLAIVLL